ncbi:unnamed protein product [Polarella glacialis]|uniref:Uncharacterized protein n=1 Tax=Polarella glacialis TaxID=89957 RepID=A0A813KJU2_POLGL|nr:unnamed protein product [Polarella glacialis]
MAVSDSEVAELLFRPERVDSSDEDERAQARRPPQRPSSSASAQQRPRASRPRPTSAPCRGELQVMDLQVMTAEAVSLFRAGRQQDALDIAVAFSDLAQSQAPHLH